MSATPTTPPSPPVIENFVERDDGLWEHALPFPLMGLRKRCECGRHFWTTAGYARHWRSIHDHNRLYIREPVQFRELFG